MTVLTPAAALIALCAAPIIATESKTAAPDHSKLDGILRENVRNERVDSLAIRKHHRRTLDEYLRMLEKVDVATLGRPDQLACHINLYNATMIRVIVDRYRDGYSTSERDYAAFKEPLVRLRDRTVSLNELENKIIRPTF